jgi:hypothetical protein
MSKNRLRWPLALAALLAVGTGAAIADVVRYHFVPVTANGQTAYSPGPAAPKPPTHFMTFRHAYTCQLVTVPVTLPEGTPRVEHVRDRIVFNYQVYAVTVQFFPDGSVDVLYNSGLFRPL